MMLDMNFFVQTTVILAFIWAIFSYVILKPLNAQIADLRALYTSALKELSAMRDLMQSNSERIVILERDVKSAHKRIDTIEHYIKPNIG